MHLVRRPRSALLANSLPSFSSFVFFCMQKRHRKGRLHHGRTPEASGYLAPATDPANSLERCSSNGGEDDHKMMSPLHDESISSTEGQKVDRKEAARLKMFYDQYRKRCLLCGDAVLQWEAHCNFVPHQARQGIVERILSGNVGRPDQVNQHFWTSLGKNKRLSPSGFQGRIPELSHATSSTSRRRRVICLLQFLHKIGVIKETFGVLRGKGKHYVSLQLHRTMEFERFEMIGDNVVKYAFHDPLAAMFPPSEGGLTGRLQFVQQLIDSNDGLLRIYDYLELDDMIGLRLANSKFKADVVEALFGELQVYLFATQIQQGNEEYSYPYDSVAKYVRLLVEHTFHELIHVIIMWAVESTVVNAKEFIQKNFQNYRLKPETRKKYDSRPFLNSVRGMSRRYRGTPVAYEAFLRGRLLEVSTFSLKEYQISTRQKRRVQRIMNVQLGKGITSLPLRGVFVKLHHCRTRGEAHDGGIQDGLLSQQPISPCRVEPAEDDELEDGEVRLQPEEKLITVVTKKEKCRPYLLIPRRLYFIDDYRKGKGMSSSEMPKDEYFTVGKDISGGEVEFRFCERCPLFQSYKLSYPSITKQDKEFSLWLDKKAHSPCLRPTIEDRLFVLPRLQQGVGLST